jgi:hypothetical protein
LPERPTCGGRRSTASMSPWRLTRPILCSPPEPGARAARSASRSRSSSTTATRGWTTNVTRGRRRRSCSPRPQVCRETGLLEGTPARTLFQDGAIAHRDVEHEEWARRCQRRHEEAVARNRCVECRACLNDRMEVTEHMNIGRRPTKRRAYSADGVAVARRTSASSRSSRPAVPPRLPAPPRPQAGAQEARQADQQAGGVRDLLEAAHGRASSHTPAGTLTAWR